MPPTFFSVQEAVNCIVIGSTTADSHSEKLSHPTFFCDLSIHPPPHTSLLPLSSLIVLLPRAHPAHTSPLNFAELSLPAQS